jgi:hypothetical protein
MNCLFGAVRASQLRLRLLAFTLSVEVSFKKELVVVVVNKCKHQ